ncbi:hypothetical protein HRR83_009439 [Exophiala dermatitidis]|uniref:Uncharacterized protein n=1 Tax=Exophiala dermatitidis TaxID=5970 RepID=A0AAN6EMD3_EXODE|nr:hypothetical protein HRR73_009526 [Exophiala dermatitidis]KAJ4502757.1 hypothetical protein HRR74_009514 [Exophiala dermatitidis]KAJ4530344.1 hypothetical protein HRR77_009495 [Exophiala dermatitidis]KAJ4534269.1 hypothetical protein HRR76_006199 [Exophiala dermatitidis]KAJ4553268.1 hypothetical protein HRR79_009725 [Exophiala dermatitidis]
MQPGMPSPFLSSRRLAFKYLSLSTALTNTHREGIRSSSESSSSSINPPTSSIMTPANHHNRFKFIQKDHANTWHNKIMIRMPISIPQHFIKKMEPQVSLHSQQPQECCK